MQALDYNGFICPRHTVVKVGFVCRINKEVTHSLNVSRVVQEIGCSLKHSVSKFLCSPIY